MKSEGTSPVILLSIIIVSFMAIGYLLLNPTIKEKIVEVPAPEKAMTLFMFDSWGENINNSNEVIFSGWIYNFGFVEAKNVTIKCTVTRYGEQIYSTIYNAGNVGSTSYKWVDITRPYKTQTTDFGVCVIDSCGDNCIDLYGRMPPE